MKKWLSSAVVWEDRSKKAMCLAGLIGIEEFNAKLSHDISETVFGGETKSKLEIDF
ncbi:MAG: hypothetical protein RRC34_00010 [Lentisphaeria bacterium]|nr:hypothetical protein [Lentisphaeria bacterium]